MNYFKRILFFSFIFCLSSKINAQFISINDQKTPQQLIENTLVNSSCVSVTNVSGTGDTFTPGKNSFAYFNAGTSNFPFKEGVVLTTSTSSSARGPYISNQGGGDDKWQGDFELNQILGINSINATVLEFDFVPLTDFLSFNYIFASNEYQSFFPCSYSDGFAFLIKEAGTDDEYKNLAVLPGTNTPVSSINIRPETEPGYDIKGAPYPGCPESNENYFNGQNKNTSPVNYAGQTIIMNAQTALITGKKYHVKLVIADDRNRFYDSAVFLESGSFSSKIDFGPDQTTLTNYPVCFGESIILDTKLPAAYSYKWFKDGVLINSENSPVYKATASGTYKVEATVTASVCVLTGEINLEFAPEIIANNTKLIQCDDDTDGTSVFNLTKAADMIKNNDAAILNKGYYESLADAESKTNEIAAPEKYTNKSANQIIFARIENKYGCFKTPQITLEISGKTIPNQNPIPTCDLDNNQDGFYQFDLDLQVTPQIRTGLPTGLIINYYLNAADALAETNVLPNIFKNTIPFSQTIYARAVNGADCYAITPITLVVNTFDPPAFEEETKSLCKGSQIDLTVDPAFSSYLWNVATNNTNSLITVSEAGDYSVKVTNEFGCEKTKKFQVILSEPAVITGAVIKDFSGTDNSVTLQYTGTGNYEFSLNGIDFQDDPFFANVSPGVYNAVAQSKDNCGISNYYLLYVLDYPKFFTPNGDGINDVWAIKNLDQLPDYRLSIFNRYGKLLKQMTQNSPGWNGQFNGQQLPSDDYWFDLIFTNGKDIKGHFSIKR
ncbi:gliding motility-associated C-terminal domain-containing protein [Flavobacterium circumlabens]|uniref:Gliding motility-associated C-terminal domain-containing protein n=1 Tax=Flavobacterium circumlabens TaxID=2133765 RepID=A0A4Y7UC35_9FLAO|nr:gliding motility-associated-like protein [Flavobacterium circumlabens]TEB44000.1 gliding motility-associated C-terminal domain-containing protein [Flavobacterium circumlabens]